MYYILIGVETTFVPDDSVFYSTLHRLVIGVKYVYIWKVLNCLI